MRTCRVTNYRCSKCPVCPAKSRHRASVNAMQNPHRNRFRYARRMCVMPVNQLVPVARRIMASYVRPADVRIWNSSIHYRIFSPVNRFGNYVVLTPPKLPYPVDLLHSPYTVVSTTVRHCERNITFVFLCTRVRSARLYIFCCEADQIPRAGPCDSRTPIRCPTTVRRMMAPRHASLPVMPCPRTTYSLW